MVVTQLKIHNSITAATKTKSRLNYHISKELQSTKLNKLTLEIIAAANKLLADGIEQHSIAGILAKKFKRTCYRTSFTT